MIVWQEHTIHFQFCAWCLVVIACQFGCCLRTKLLDGIVLAMEGAADLRQFGLNQGVCADIACLLNEPRNLALSAWCRFVQALRKLLEEHKAAVEQAVNHSSLRQSTNQNE